MLSTPPVLAAFSAKDTLIATPPLGSSGTVVNFSFIGLFVTGLDGGLFPEMSPIGEPRLLDLIVPTSVYGHSK